MITDATVSLLRVTQRQARVLVDEGVAILALINKVLAITVLNCARLHRTRRSTRAGGCRSRRARNDIARDRSWIRLVKSLDAIRLSSLKTTTLSSNRRVPQSKEAMFFES